MHLEQLPAASGQGDGAIDHDVAAVGEPEGMVGILLDEENGQLLASVQFADRREDLAHDERGETERGLVEEQEARARHQRAGDRQHLLLAARERAAALVDAFLQAREKAKDALAILSEMLEADDRRTHLMRLVNRFRSGIEEAGLETLPGPTPIIPVMLHEAQRAQAMAAALDERGVYVAGFFYPVVPKGKARIRTQMSAALSEGDIDVAVRAFTDAGRAIGLI